jgi:sulfur-carrier protein
MKIHVLFFGPIADELKCDSMFFENEKNVSSLKENILKKFPRLKDFTFRISVNQCFDENADLKDGDEVALLPPFSGG